MTKATFPSCVWTLTFLICVPVQLWEQEWSRVTCKYTENTVFWGFSLVWREWDKGSLHSFKLQVSVWKSLVLRVSLFLTPWQGRKGAIKGGSQPQTRRATCTLTGDPVSQINFFLYVKKLVSSIWQPQKAAWHTPWSRISIPKSISYGFYAD